MHELDEHAQSAINAHDASFDDEDEESDDEDEAEVESPVRVLSEHPPPFHGFPSQLDV